MLVWEPLSSFMRLCHYQSQVVRLGAFRTRVNLILPFIILILPKPEATQEPTDISTIELKGLDVEPLQY